MTAPAGGEWGLIARHGPYLGHDDLAALRVIRHTMLGLEAHGSISDLNTYAGETMTVWSFRAGDEDGAEVLRGLLDVVADIAPGDWEVDVTARGRATTARPSPPGRPAGCRTTPPR